MPERRSNREGCRYCLAVTALLVALLLPSSTVKSQCGTDWTCETVAQRCEIPGNRSVALDSTGKIAVAYVETAVGGGPVWLAYDLDGDGSFTSPGELSCVSSTTSALGVSLAFDDSGRPAIAFQDATAGLFLARDLDGDFSFADPGEITSVDCAQCSHWLGNLAFDSNGSPAICYTRGIGLSELRIARDLDNDQDFSSPGEIVVVAASTGGESSLAFDHLGRPAICYYEPQSLHLKLAIDLNSNGSFADPGEKRVVDKVGEDLGSPGCVFHCLAFDGAGRAAVSYMDEDHGAVRLAHDRDGNGSFSSPGEIVYVDGTVTGASSTSLTFDASGRACMIYFVHHVASPPYKLRFAYDENADGDFADPGEIVTVDCTMVKGVGGLGSLALDHDGHPVIAYSEYALDADLKLARHEACATGYVTIVLEAEVEAVYDPAGLLGGAIIAGTRLDGHFFYTCSAPDLSPLSTIGNYAFSSFPWAVELSGGGLQFRTDPAGTGFMIAVTNDHGTPPRDTYAVVSDSNLPLSTGALVDRIYWQLDDDSATALCSDELPVIAPSLGNWQSSFKLNILGHDPSTLSADTFLIRARVTHTRRI